MARRPRDAQGDLFVPAVQELVDRAADAAGVPEHLRPTHGFATGPEGSGVVEVDPSTRDRILRKPFDSIDEEIRRTVLGDFGHPATMDLDDLALLVRQKIGRGLSVSWALGSSESPASRLARVVWDSWTEGDPIITARCGFFPSQRAGLLHVLEYERVREAEGRDAADRFHARSGCRSEVEAIGAMDEREGVVREDPHRGDPRFANDQKNHSKRRL